MGRGFTKVLPLSCRDYFIALYYIAVSFWRHLSAQPFVFPARLPSPRPPPPPRVSTVLRQAPRRWIPPPLSRLFPNPEPGVSPLFAEAQLIWSCHGNILATVLLKGYRKAW